MIDDRTQKTNEQLTPDLDGGSVPLTPEESLLIANFRAGRTKEVLRLYLKKWPDNPDKPSTPRQLSEDAFYRLSVHVLNMLMLFYIEKDEIGPGERFNPVDLLEQIETAIREGLLSRAVDHVDLKTILRLNGFE